MANGLLQSAQPATTIECDGCEENCAMPVTVYPAQDNKPGRAFIACDKRDDIGRVCVDFRRMEQWQASDCLIATALARLLGLGQPSNQTAEGRQWRIGTFKGKKHNSPVTLLAGDGFTLALAGHTVSIEDVLAIEKNVLALDNASLIRLVDNPADNSETEAPEARRERIRKRVREEKVKGTRAFLKVVADEEGFSTSRLKQLINDKPEPINKWTELAGLSTPSSSKKTKPKY